jgi:hypothetical protein
MYNQHRRRHMTEEAVDTCTPRWSMLPPRAYYGRHTEPNTTPCSCYPTHTRTPRHTPEPRRLSGRCYYESVTIAVRSIIQGEQKGERDGRDTDDKTAKYKKYHVTCRKHPCQSGRVGLEQTATAHTQARDTHLHACVHRHACAHMAGV